MTDQELIQHALEVRRNSYSPYSNFAVSAALLSDDGRVFTGVNVENSSFGLTNCAERVAIGAAITAGARSFTTLAIVLKGGGSPCGACRQVLYEFAPSLRILMADEQGHVVKSCSLADLLPEAFGPKSL